MQKFSFILQYDLIYSGKKKKKKLLFSYFNFEEWKISGDISQYQNYGTQNWTSCFCRRKNKMQGEQMQYQNNKHGDDCKGGKPKTLHLKVTHLLIIIGLTKIGHDSHQISV